MNKLQVRNNLHSHKYLTSAQAKRQNANLEGAVVNNFIKDNNSTNDLTLNDTYNTLLISDEKKKIEEHSSENLKNKGFSFSKALMPLIAGTTAIFASSALLSVMLKSSAKKNLTTSFKKQLPPMGINLNIRQETGFATYMALRDPSRKNIMAAIAVFAFSGLTLLGKKFTEGFKEIWIKKQDADISRDLQEDLIDVETKAFSGKLDVVRNMLTENGEYLSNALHGNVKKEMNTEVFARNFNFKGIESNKNGIEKEKKENRLMIALSGMALVAGVGLSAITLKNIKNSAKIQDEFINTFIKEKSNLLTDIMKNKNVDTDLLSDTLIKMGASKAQIMDYAKKAGLDGTALEDFSTKVSDGVDNIWGNAPTGLSTESGKAFFYCYLDEARGHLYNWLIHSDNPFLKNLFFAMASVSATSFMAQESVGALKDVAVLKENAKTELELQKMLVDVEIKNFKAKKDSAIKPLIEEFERKKKMGKSPEGLKVMADNILLEIKNGPPFVYS